MAEVSFARQFLAQLDARPSQYPPDHILDPAQLPRSTPVRPPHPYSHSPHALR